MARIGRTARENVGIAFATGAMRTDESRIGEDPPRTWAPAAEQTRVVASAAATKWTVLAMVDSLLYIKDARAPLLVAEAVGIVSLESFTSHVLRLVL